MRAKTSDYELLNKYYKPALEQYDLALAEKPDCGFMPEIENVLQSYEYYKYLVEDDVCSIRSEEFFKMQL